MRVKLFAIANSLPWNPSTAGRPERSGNLKYNTSVDWDELYTSAG
jgi:hypothetical protein